MSSKSSSANETQTINTDDRVATGDGGIVLQNEGSNSTITFEDVSPEVIEKGFALAASLFEDVLEGSASVVNSALNTSNEALSNTQSLAQNLFEEKNTPSSDNIRNIIYALVGGVAVIGIAYFWSKRK